MAVLEENRPGVSGECSLQSRRLSSPSRPGLPLLVVSRRSSGALCLFLNRFEAARLVVEGVANGRTPAIGRPTAAATSTIPQVHPVAASADGS